MTSLSKHNFFQYVFFYQKPSSCHKFSGSFYFFKQQATAHEIDFEFVQGYRFVGHENDLSMLFFAIKSSQEWQANFQPYPGHYAPACTPVNFEKYVAIAIIKQSQDHWVLRPRRVLIEEGDISFEYEAYTSEKNIGWRNAAPLIVLVPKASYKSVRFIENGSIMKKIENFDGKRDF